MSDRDDVRLYLGDCANLLSDLEERGVVVDAVITDPPFGIGFKYESHDDTAEGYGEWLWPLLERAEALCAPGSPVFVFQAMKHVRRWAEWIPRDFRLYAAAKNFVQVRPQAMNHCWDPVLVWWTEGKRHRPPSPPINRDYIVSDTAREMPSNSRGIARLHPCPRQDDVLLDLVRYCRPGGLVLDLFAGSGTTAVACVATGRRFVGAEIEPLYFDLSLRRVDLARQQRRLFAAEAPPEQVSLLEGEA